MNYLNSNIIRKMQIFITMFIYITIFSRITYSQTIDISVSKVNMPSLNFTMHPGQNFIPSAVFRNVGTIRQVQVPVRFELINVSGSVIYLSNRTISEINSGIDSNISFDEVTTGLSSGTYRFRVSQLLTTDINSANDKSVGVFFVNWDSTASMAFRRSGHTANILADGRVLITGGNIPGFIYSSCEFYEPEVDNGFGGWSNAPSMSVARFKHSATTLPDGKILITGGVNESFQRERSSEIFNPEGNAGLGIWNSTDSMVLGRYMHTATLLQSGKVLVVGGLSPNGISPTCELFDPTGNDGQGKWLNVTSLNIARSGHTAVLLSDGKVLVVGGENASQISTSSCEIFDPSANGGLGSWTITDSMSAVRNGHKTVLLSSGKVLVTGGGSQVSEIFDASGNGNWSNSGPMIEKRSYHTATLLMKGKVLVAGGGSNSCEIFDPNGSEGLGTWEIASAMRISRSSHTISELMNGKLVVVGGSSVGTQTINGCELFDTTESRSVRLPTQLKITSIIPDAPIVGAGFSVIVESVEDNGQPQNVLLPTTIHIFLTAGTGLLGGTVSGIIPSGENRLVLSGLTYNIAEDNVQLKAAVDDGMALLSDTSESFSVFDIPSQVELLSPYDKMEITVDSISFVWQKSFKAVTKYWLEISTDSLFENAVIDSLISDTTIVINSLVDNKTQWWRVKAANIAGWGSFSTARSFITNISPAQPQLLLADPGNFSVTLTWQKNQEKDISRYYIFQGTNHDSLVLVDSTTNLNDTSIIIHNLTNDQIYVFSVVAIDSFKNMSLQSAEISTSPSLFTEMNSAGLDTLKNGSIALGDFNNDGSFDVLMTGELDTARFSKVYENKGEGVFEDIYAQLTDIKLGQVEWCDYNNDNILDILLAGLNGYRLDPGTTRLYQNLGSNQFVNIENSFGQFGNSCAYGDYDNDGRIDLIVSGYSGLSLSGSTKLFHNDGNGIFSQTNAIFPQVQNACFTWADYDTDGDLDLLLVGGDELGYAKLFQNNGSVNDTGWVFKEVSVPFTGTNGGTSVASWGDYDNDGDLDLIIVGWDPIAHLETSKIYRNDGGGSFVNINASLPLIGSGDVMWGDYDNDGILDLAFSNYRNSKVVPIVHHNNGNGIFSSADAGIRSGAGRVVWGDYDSDGDLDLITSKSLSVGSNIFVKYRNNSNTVNAVPSAPKELKSIVTNNTVCLTWQRSDDKETPVKGLSYNLSVGTTKTGCEIMSPMADLATGFRKVAKLGNVNQDTTWEIRKLLPGKYYWTVQAIDHSFAGSEFASVDSFVITTTGIQSTPFTGPIEFSLDQNYPNPWNPSTTIRYGLPKPSIVRLLMFNILGQQISQLVYNYQEAGYHEVVLQSDKLASGVYIYCLRAGEFEASKKFILLK
ncbi:MAG: FG-GAP-like repeat-containing protein [Ignavibacteriaceae bacterium]|jgi:hypothetical protein